MLLKLVRFGIPAVLITAGILVLCFGAESVRYEIFGMSVGAGLALLLFTFFIQMGYQGDREREEEEAARDYYSQHGRWPDDPRYD